MILIRNCIFKIENVPHILDYYSLESFKTEDKQFALPFKIVLAIFISYMSVGTLVSACQFLQ